MLGKRVSGNQFSKFSGEDPQTPARGLRALALAGELQPSLVGKARPCPKIDFTPYAYECDSHAVAEARSTNELFYDTIRGAILTCARKPTRVGLVYRTEPTTNKKLSYRRGTDRAMRRVS